MSVLPEMRHGAPGLILLRAPRMVPPSAYRSGTSASARTRARDGGLYLLLDPGFQVIGHDIRRGVHLARTTQHVSVESDHRARRILEFRNIFQHLRFEFCKEL